MKNSTDHLNDEIVKAWLGEESEKRKLEGYVYVLRFRECTKIGWTQDTTRRLKEFNSLLPDNVSFEHVLSVSDVDAAEDWLHKRFEEKNIKNEWFLLNKEDIDFIVGLGSNFYLQ